MYCILNETHQVIAADKNFLTYCDATHIDELSTKISKGNIGFNLESDKIFTLTLNNKKEVFSANTVMLSSLLDQLTLINIFSDNTDEDASNPSFLLEDGPNEPIDSIINDTDNTDTLSMGNTEEDLILDNTLDDAFLSVKDETEEKSKQNVPSLSLPDDDVLFNLALDNDTPKPTNKANQSEAIDFGLSDENDIAINLGESEEELSEILIDSEAISQKMGLSNDDYKNFLNDFIDTALNLEKDLQSQNDDIRNDAVNTLSHLSDVLHLHVIADIISNIKDNDTQRADIESLYSTLSRITTEESTVPKNNLVSDNSTETDKTAFALEEEGATNDKLELFDEPILEPIIQENVPATNTHKGNSFGSISLEGVRPKHFDFQLEKAANDLSLPIELIEEFVNDFIEQAHTETKKMLQAYEDGDLNAIQKIGHLLKGASSNLRINALSDTLYKIQFCENSNDLETLIKDYWSHFLSFETQINAISHQRK